MTFWFRCCFLAGIFCAWLVQAADGRVPWTTSKFQSSPETPAKFRLTRAFTNLAFTNPIDVAYSPELGRWFVGEQSGKIFSFDAAGEKKNLAVDLGPLQGREGAFYALAFDPRFASNRFIYICYALKPELPDGSHVSRFKVRSEGEPRIDLDSEELIITWLSGGHNGCALEFGKDGMLYISTGDAAGPNPPDPLKTGQDLTDLMSSVLRIDVHRRDAGKNYAVPPDNPFVGREKVRPEIWAYGFRNPWRMGFDRETGDLWVGDVGWELWELIYLVERGGNYGWSIMEGRQPVRPADPRGPTPILPPTKEHPHNEAASITGGIVYYGKRFPELRGAFVYGDWETGKIWAIKAADGKVTWFEELADSTTRIVAFAEDERGEVMVLDYNGGLYRLELNAAAYNPAAFPKKLSESGLFASVADLKPAAGVYPFTVLAPLWRDFAESERLIGLPGLSAVRLAAKLFPSNAVLATTFSLEMERGVPASTKRIETQVLHHTGDGWGAYSYRWNAEQTDAELVPAEGQDEVLRVKDAQQPGGIRQQPWRFHSRAECLRCHNSWCGTVLGFQPEQLGPRLADLEKLGLIKAPPAAKHLVNPHDTGADLAARARSYLHANCSHCHRDNAGGSVPSVMNFDLPLEKTRMLNARPVLGDLGLDNGKVIAAGNPFSSVLLFRASATGRSRMPYLSSELVDEKGVVLLREWIASLGSGTTNAVKSKPASTSEALQLAHALIDYPLNERQRLAEEAVLVNNPLFRELFDRFLPASAQTTLHHGAIPKNEILARNGDARRGAALLTDSARASCLQCHTFKGQGRPFGPDLAVAARGKTREELLESIMEPSRQIAPEYILYTVELGEDEALSGILLSRSAQRVLLRDAAGVDHDLPASRIKDLRPQQLSAMPEGLLDGLTAQETADLLEALAEAK